MASSFPSSVDSFPDPLVNSPLNSPSHAGLHTDVNDAVEKLETKVGVGASPAASATAGQVLTATGTGSSWQTPAVTAAQFATVGLVYITGGTFSAQDPLSVTNCFTSTYDHYEIVLQYYGSAANNTSLNFYTGTNTIYNAANYYRYGFYLGTGALANFYAAGLTAAFVTNHSNTSSITAPVRMTVFAPNLSTSRTQIMHKALDPASGLFIDLMHQIDSTNQFTGFQIDAASGSITGNYAVYGYRKA